MNQWKYRAAIMAIIGLALALRLAMAGWMLAGPEGAWFTPDSHLYIQGAGQIGQGETFLPDRPILPPFPAILAAIHAATGEYRWVLLINALAGGLTVWLTMLVARGIFGPRVALAAGAIQAVNPVAIMHVGFVLTDSIGAAILWAGMYWMIRSYRGRGAPAAGLAFAAYLFLRPVAKYWAIPAAALAWFGPSGWRRVAWMVLPMILVVAVWTGRNWVVRGEPHYAYKGAENMIGTLVWMMDSQGLNLDLDGRADMRRDYRRDIGFIDGICIIARNPGRFTKLMITHALTFTCGASWIRQIIWPDVETGGMFRAGIATWWHNLRDNPMANVFYYIEVYIMSFGLFGLFVLGVFVCKFDRATLTLLVLFGYIMAATILTTSSYCRFRIPVLPVEAIFAAVALGKGWALWKRSRFLTMFIFGG